MWNEEGLALAVRAAPPFWQTWWFRALSALTAIAAVAFGFQVRTRQIRKRNVLLEALVDERTRDLKAAQDKLVRQEKLATLGELAGSVAHESRNPLAVIGNALFLLRRKASGGERQIELIGEQIKRTNSIVSELLDFARGSSTAAMRFPLQDAAEEALGEIEIPPGIEVERELDDRPLIVEADPEQIQRILLNLIDNALQAMPDGGQLRLQCCRVGDEAAISVIDTGEGISEEDFPGSSSRCSPPGPTASASGCLCRRDTHD